MSGVTPFLGLILPADGESYDVDILNTNYGTIDTALKNADKSAKGLVTRYFNAATTGNFNTIEGLVDYQLVSLVKDRWYRIDYRANVVSAGANQPIDINIKKDSNTTATTGFATGGTISTISTIDKGVTANSPSLPNTVLASVTFQAAATENLLIKITGNLSATSGTNFQWNNRAINLYDMGTQIP